MEIASGGVVIEGHICPNCKKLCDGINDLQKHFEQCDSTNKIDSWKKNVSNMIGKAKNRIKATVNISEHHPSPVVSSLEEDIEPLVVTNVVGWNRFEGENVTGTVTKLTNEFLDMRGSHIIRVNERVCTRIKNMHKLFDVLSKERISSPKKLKATEKGAVKWVDDKDVRYCRTCCRGFGLKRRRHHCRVCGGIMCKTCSYHLPYRDAAVVIGHKLGVRVRVPQPGLLRKKKHPKSTEDDEDPEEEDSFLVCMECDILLRKQLMVAKEAMEVPPPVVRLHTHMLEVRDEINSLKPNYLRICESLIAGETTFNLDRAQVERVRIVKACERFDGISKRILSLCDAPGKTPVTPREERLYKNIRQSAAVFLQANMICLQPLPQPEELQEMREARERERLEAERREAERRRERKEAALKQKMQSTMYVDGDVSLGSEPPGQDGAKRRGESGSVAWIPESNPVIKEENDPFLLQYQRLVGYIEQAHKANRLDEVEALEVSLRQIEREIIERKYQTLDRN